MSNSQLDTLISPEIKDDEFYNLIQRISEEEDIKTVLEIGSSSGGGSTEAFVKGLRENPNQPTLFCMEVSKVRFEELQKTYQDEQFVKCYNVSSVEISKFPDESEIEKFYEKFNTNLNFYSLDLVLSWLRQDIEYVEQSGVPVNGISKIKEENDIDYFDVVLIDGSEFTGFSELKEVYGAKFILLDDINAFKNYHGHCHLLRDCNYELIAENKEIRNGYSIFKKKKNSQCITLTPLPIHFFTIVLNGKPFIEYHRETFKELPFKWHWHIVEGVAELKHDTAWSLSLGGEISEAIHNRGRSKDGTSEYLDELAKEYPENITIYRQPEGQFWDGKREMVNAPLANIQEECLLWQIDVDELWTVEQICTGRDLFITHPEKTAAYYWCWYFVGEDLIISTRNCYTQNPKQEWLRTWHFKPGYQWVAHEPPVLAEPLPEGHFRNVAALNYFTHAETESEGLVFQHFAYVIPEQLQFKEQYYGYKNALTQWQNLRNEKYFPVLLRNHFAWVGDNTQVQQAETLGIVPIYQKGKDDDRENFHFLNSEELEIQQGQLFQKIFTPKIVVDGIFFQYYRTGIARVWRTLLEEWVESGFSKHLLVLSRGGTTPEISGIDYRVIPNHNYQNSDADRELLQQICDEEGADLFISSYYTTPISTPSVFMAYDMIPEVLGADFTQPMWREKHYGIQHASAYITISENTAYDLVKCFPDISSDSVRVAHCGVNRIFSPASLEEIEQFKFKYGIAKPYFLLVAPGTGYKNSQVFFKAFTKLYTKFGFDLVCTGNKGLLEEELRNEVPGIVIHTLPLSDEELRLAYGGAVALVYPSKYEGFGLPVLEALACGCPVITTPNASLPEVAGDAALYVKGDDVEGMMDALCEVQKPSVRQGLIAAGLEQAKKFSWSKMAGLMQNALIDATLLPLNLREENWIVFPDWSQSEETVGSGLQDAIRAIARHPNRHKMTLLIDTQDISQEDANLLVSGIAMNLLLEEDLEGVEEVAISFVEQLGEIQWEALFLRLQGRLILECDNRDSIARVGAEQLSALTLEDFA
ncbi:glycosyltransferase family 4 protein [Lusitaniella coriacea]|uniref:glycosyltransferase family 4 protein n=1 Tax=Lusitaniella coriacea TaxID=1983105 RepID=UPI003CE95B96